MAEAVVIGAGHNGLACGCYLAGAGLDVVVFEEYPSVGGMTLTEELAAPAFGQTFTRAATSWRTFR